MLLLIPMSEWKPGDKVKTPVGTMASYDTTTTHPRMIYSLINGTIIPRPIALVSTVDDQKRTNLAPFSSFNLVSSKPATCLFSVTTKRDTTTKDTLRNIKLSKEFVVNSVSTWMLDPTHFCSGEFPADYSELDASGFTPVPSIVVTPPRIKEAAVQFECKLDQFVQVGDGGVGSAVIVIGTILMIHIMREAIDGDKVDFDKLQIINRLGGTWYGETIKLRSLPPAKI